MKKGRKIATRNNLSIYYSDDNWHSVFTPDDKCLSEGYFCFANAERFCLNNTDYVKKPHNYKKKTSNKTEETSDDTLSTLNKVAKAITALLEMDGSLVWSETHDGYGVEIVDKAESETQT